MPVDTLAEAFGVTPLHEIPTTDVIDVESHEFTNVSSEEPPHSPESDFELAQDTIRDAIKKTAAAIDDLIGLAKASEHPRAYEVLNGMLAQITSSSESLLEIHKKKKEIVKKDETPGNVTNNNTLVMTTADVLKLLRGKPDQSVES